MNVRNLALAVMATLSVVFLASARIGPRKGAIEPQDPCAEACDAEPGLLSGALRSVLAVLWRFLYLRPRNDGLEYAVPINGPITEARFPSRSAARPR